MQQASPVERHYRLTQDETKMLLHLRADLEREVMDQYETQLRQCRNRIVDPSRWKHFQSDGDVHAYRERDMALQETLAQIECGTPCGPQTWLAVQSRLPRVMVVGSVPGTLDDVMYGHTYRDSATLRMHHAYQRDLLDRSSVLAVLEDATQDDPYRFLGLSLEERSFPIVRDRAALLLNDIRLSALATGERIGIHVVHSVHVQSLSHLQRPGTVRIDVSVARVFRQRDADNVDVFMMDFLDTKSSAPETLFLQDLVATLLTVRTISDTALNKKLCYRLRHRSREKLRRRRSATLVIDDKGELPRQCEYCDRRLGGLFNSSGRKCQLCDKQACLRCSTKRGIVIEATAAEIVAMPFEFCVACILQTRVMDTFSVARDELCDRRVLADLARRYTEKISLSNESSSDASSMASSPSHSRRWRPPPPPPPPPSTHSLVRRGKSA